MTTNKDSKTIIAYKGLEHDLSSFYGNFKYEVDKEYEVDNPSRLKLCEYGFHACIDPKDVLQYYNFEGHRFFKVLLSGNILTGNGIDSKCCASKIKILEEVNIIDEIIKSDKETSNLFKDNEQTYLANNFLGMITSADDWYKVKSECKIGSRMLIIDDMYDTTWRCVNIDYDKDLYHFLVEYHIGLYQLDYYDSNRSGPFSTKLIWLNDTWLYKSILHPLENKYISIFGDTLVPLNIDIFKNKLSLPSLKIISTNNPDCFTYFKINSLIIAKNEIKHDWPGWWINTSNITQGIENIVIGNCNIANAHVNDSNFVRPLICLK